MRLSWRMLPMKTLLELSKPHSRMLYWLLSNWYIHQHRRTALLKKSVDWGLSTDQPLVTGQLSFWPSSDLPDYCCDLVILSLSRCHPHPWTWTYPLPMVNRITSTHLGEMLFTTLVHDIQHCSAHTWHHSLSYPLSIPLCVFRCACVCPCVDILVFWPYPHPKKLVSSLQSCRPYEKKSMTESCYT